MGIIHLLITFEQIFKVEVIKVIKHIQHVKIACLLILVLLSKSLYSQADRILLRGTVADTSGNAVSFATVSVSGTGFGTTTNENGSFTLYLNVAKMAEITVVIACLGFRNDTAVFDLSTIAKQVTLNVKLMPETHRIGEVLVTTSQRRVGNIEKLNVKDVDFIPNISGNFESLLKSLPGVSSSNELSSQYSVRGGNFDENLVYVNDIEIFRPFLVRAGQQEGLSFVNPDLVSSVEFSAGAFSAEFGDKMSSVLNVQYRTPKEFATNVSVSLLGANASFEGVSKNKKATFISGIRYKTSRYLLNTLDVHGDYNPSFFDWQGLFTYSFSDKFSLNFLGNFASNRFNFAPETRETRFGMFSNSLQLKVYYEGQEVNSYVSGTGAMYADYAPSKSVKLKLIASSYLSDERETFDLLGQYYLNELDNSLGSSTYSDSLINVGIGGFLNHARNFLRANLYSLSHIGTYFMPHAKLKWGLVWQYEHITDEINEWNLIDSSGYALPYTGTEVGLNDIVRANNSLSINKLSAYTQYEQNFSLGSFRVNTIAGLRGSYWSYSKSSWLSPRVSFSVKRSNWRDLLLHLSSGVYYQPPFYREFRMTDGTLNPNIKPQKSVQLLGGMEYFFTAWNRPFRLSAEVYQKWFSDLIPYKIDNVRIVYAGENLSKGYARGVDVKVNGELVDGAESWVGISYMKTMEDILNDSYTDSEGNVYYPGYFSRPTDQRLRFSLFFQDYLPGNKTFRVQLTGVYGSGLPVGVEGNDRYDVNFRMPAYKRVDIGFTKILKSSGQAVPFFRNRLKGVKNLWISVEVFNLFDFNNTISYLWVQTVANQKGTSDKYAVPNYLTSRRLNFKLTLTF